MPASPIPLARSLHTACGGVWKQNVSKNVSTLAQNVSKNVSKGPPGKTKVLRGSPTIYNAATSAANYKGYLRAKVPAGMYLQRPQASATGSASSETTPEAFLPGDDPRRKYVRQWSNTQREALENKYGPAVLCGRRVDAARATPLEKTFHLSPAQVQELARLRNEDPRRNTRRALAAKFNVSPLFVSLVSSAPASRLQTMDKRLARIKASWSSGRAAAREDRKKRKELWYRP